VQYFRQGTEGFHSWCFGNEAYIASPWPSVRIKRANLSKYFL